MFYLLGSLAAFVCGLHRDVGLHPVGRQVSLSYSGSSLLSDKLLICREAALYFDIGYDFLLLSSQAVSASQSG